MVLLFCKESVVPKRNRAPCPSSEGALTMKTSTVTVTHKMIANASERARTKGMWEAVMAFDLLATCWTMAWGENKAAVEGLFIDLIQAPIDAGSLGTVQVTVGQILAELGKNNIMRQNALNEQKAWEDMYGE